MNNELDLNNQLLNEDLFHLFKMQLEKDFQSSAVNADFIESLTPDFQNVKEKILLVVGPLVLNNSTLLSALFYRIDISEQQLKSYTVKNKQLQFEEIVAELIIKRILQKVILKKKFSK